MEVVLQLRPFLVMGRGYIGHHKYMQIHTVMLKLCNFVKEKPYFHVKNFSGFCFWESVVPAFVTPTIDEYSLRHDGTVGQGAGLFASSSVCRLFTVLHIR